MFALPPLFYLSLFAHVIWHLRRARAAIDKNLAAAEEDDRRDVTRTRHSFGARAKLPPSE